MPRRGSEQPQVSGAEGGRCPSLVRRLCPMPGAVDSAQRPLRDAGGLDQRFHTCPSESRARREVCVKLLLTADCSTKSLGSWFRSDKCTACTHGRFVLTSEDELNSRDLSRQVESGQQDSG